MARLPFRLTLSSACGEDAAQGGDDSFADTNADLSRKTFYGDAGGDMSGHAQGGNTLWSAIASQLTFYGDAGGNISGHTHGGDDVAVLQGTTNLAYGDAVAMLGIAVGGDDDLSGGTAAAHVARSEPRL